MTGGSGTVKINVVIGLTKVETRQIGNESDVLRIYNTGTATFFIYGAICHSILSLPVNRPFSILPGERLCQLQDNLRLIKVIMIDEVSIIGKKCCILLT